MYFNLSQNHAFYQTIVAKFLNLILFSYKNILINIINHLDEEVLVTNEVSNDQPSHIEDGKIAKPENYDIVYYLLITFLIFIVLATFVNFVSSVFSI